ncbi:MAG: hypothetical protein V2A53_04050 [bacterium]
MARQLRIEYPNAVYRLISRKDRKGAWRDRLQHCISGEKTVKDKGRKR